MVLHSFRLFSSIVYSDGDELEAPAGLLDLFGPLAGAGALQLQQQLQQVVPRGSSSGGGYGSPRSSTATTAATSGTTPAHLSGDGSLLDTVLTAMWDECAADGLFRYDLAACVTKIVPGTLGLVAQLNTGRATQKRPTEFRVDQVGD